MICANLVNVLYLYMCFGRGEHLTIMTQEEHTILSQTNLPTCTIDIYYSLIPFLLGVLIIFACIHQNYTIVLINTPISHPLYYLYTSFFQGKNHPYTAPSPYSAIRHVDITVFAITHCPIHKPISFGESVVVCPPC